VEKERGCVNMSLEGGSFPKRNLFWVVMHRTRKKEEEKNGLEDRGSRFSFFMILGHLEVLLYILSKRQNTLRF